MKTGSARMLAYFSFLLGVCCFAPSSSTQTATTVLAVSPAQIWFSQHRAYTNNPATVEIVTGLFAEPQPELSVPEMVQNSRPGTYWTLKGAPAPLPFDPFPDLPVYAISTNDIYLIDDRSVDYATLDELAALEAEASASSWGRWIARASRIIRR